MQNTKGLDNLLATLSALASERVQKKLLQAAGENYLIDTLDFINSGRSFRTRTGKLQRSIILKLTTDSIIITATAPYANAVEFGGSRLRNKKLSKPRPFLLADTATRQRHIVTTATTVLQTIIDGTS